MHALSLTQPWATLVAIGAKKIETRTWSTKHRGRIAIHASANLPAYARSLAHQPGPFYSVLSRASLPMHWDDHLPLGAILATVRLQDVVRFTPTWNGERAAATWSDAPHEVAFGDFTPDRYGWIFTDLHILPTPIPAKGQLGLWSWSGEAAA